MVTTWLLHGYYTVTTRLLHDAMLRLALHGAGPPRRSQGDAELLPTAYYLLPTAYYLLPTAYYLLPLPTTYYLLPTTHCLLLPSSSALGGTEFQLAVKRAVPHGCTFKGFPQHFTHQHAPSMLSSLMQSTTGLAIVQCKGEQARLAPLPALQPACNQPATNLE